MLFQLKMEQEFLEKSATIEMQNTVEEQLRSKMSELENSHQQLKVSTFTDHISVDVNILKFFTRNCSCQSVFKMMINY